MNNLFRRTARGQKPHRLPLKLKVSHCLSVLYILSVSANLSLSFSELAVHDVCSNWNVSTKDLFVFCDWTTHWIEIFQMYRFFLHIPPQNCCLWKLWDLLYALWFWTTFCFTAGVCNDCESWSDLAMFEMIIKNFQNHIDTKNLYNSCLIYRTQNLCKFTTSLDSASPGPAAHNSSCVGWGDVFFSCTEEAQYPVPTWALIPHWGRLVPGL